jgi:hypothetical protein
MGGKHKKCKSVEECDFIASFGFRDGIGTQFCSRHKLEGMVNLLCKSCECRLSRPTYNYKGLSANFCSQCKKDGMINVNSKMCECGKVIATFNYSGEKAKYCSKCKKEDMINVKDEPCKCGKSSSPLFNYIGLKPEYCSKCKEPDMIDVLHGRCECGKVQPSFNFKGSEPKYCKECKKDGMIMIRKRTCIQCKDKQATYNIEGLKAQYCNTCRTKDMINVVDKCKNDGCVSSGNIKYKYYCGFCFQHLFPNDEAVKNIKKKTKENYVRDFLQELNEEFIHDMPLWTGNCDCSHRRRIDFRKLVGNTLLCIEVDEFQHKRYNEKDEEIRYDDLFMLHGGKFIFIRFNPDPFKNKLGTRKNPYMKRRMEYLEEEINKQIERINNEENFELLEIIKIFYDGYDYNLS